MVFEILLDPSPQNLSQKLNFQTIFLGKVNLALENGSVKIFGSYWELANLM
jgi:hypothetical protein